MAMAAADIERLIVEGIPDATVEITDLAGDGDHYAARVIAESFRGMPRVRQHQAVYAALGGRMGGELHALQEGFMQEHGLQCGFCTPGMLTRAYRLLQENPDPSEEEIRYWMAGNLCRCTGYQNIVKAVQYAARKLRGEAVETSHPLIAETASH